MATVSQAKSQSQVRLHRQGSMQTVPASLKKDLKGLRNLTVLAAQHQNGTKQLNRNVGINIT